MEDQIEFAERASVQRWFVDATGKVTESWVDADPETPLPEGWVEVPYGPPLHADQVWSFPDGPYGPSLFVTSGEENAWREAELAGVPDQIAMIEDDDPAAVATVQQWRDYRKALRLWADTNPAFPFGTRPVRPE